MRTSRTLRISFLAVSLLFWISGTCWAAEKKFPAKPIQVIIGFQPGDTDNSLRPYIEKMPEYLGQPLTFVYKPGAAGSVGAAFVASSKPDGHTLVGTSQSSILLVPLLQKDVGYTWESFTPVSCLVEVPYFFVVQSNARWRNLKEFVAEAKKDPGKISYSSSGTLGLPHLAAEIFSREAGIKLNYIPSQGSTPAVTAVLGGHVDAVSSPAAPVVPHIRAGTMRPLAVFTKERVKAFPDIPTFQETGYKVNVSVIGGLLAPRTTPKEIIEVIYQAAKMVTVNHKAFLLDRFDKLGIQMRFASPEEYAAMLKSQHELFSAVIRELKK
jgi:tripartite-type tricarboxylate transporter receptor subunit TctC